MKIIPERSEDVKHVQGHKVEYWKRNNSAADSISLKFGAVLDLFTADRGPTLQMSRVNGSQDKVTGSKVDVTA